MDIPKEIQLIKETLREFLKEKVKKGDWAVKSIESGKKEDMVEFIKEDIEFYKGLLDKLGGDKMSTVEDAIKSAKKIIKEVETDSKPPSYDSIGRISGVSYENPSEQDGTDDSKVYHEDQGASAEVDEFAEHVGRIIGKENSDDYFLVERADFFWLMDDYDVDRLSEKRNKLRDKYLKEIEE